MNEVGLNGRESIYVAGANCEINLSLIQIDSEEEKLQETAAAIREKKKLVLMAHRASKGRNRPIIPKAVKARVYTGFSIYTSQQQQVTAFNARELTILSPHRIQLLTR